jgi:hypothetical protein
MWIDPVDAEQISSRLFGRLLRTSATFRRTRCVLAGGSRV